MEVLLMIYLLHGFRLRSYVEMLDSYNDSWPADITGKLLEFISVLVI